MKCQPVLVTLRITQMCVYFLSLLAYPPSFAFQPFQGINTGIFQDSDSKWIELVDGSTNKENIPIGPLLVKARNVDVIVAIDAGAEDSNNWPMYVSLSIDSRFLIPTAHSQR